MKISLCIPQYNRIEYLLKSLSIIEQQTYLNIEVVISDDASIDDTIEKLEQFKNNFKYPIIINKFVKNVGYDKNYRTSIELATGDYCVVLGNDDSLNGNDAIRQLVDFLIQNNLPDIGFCNYVEESNKNVITERAHFTKVLGYGSEIALKYYSCFSFVAGIIYKKSCFDKFNTDIYDKSIYAQIALGVSMISSGAILFSVKEPLVLKDLLIDGKKGNSYRDFINRSWKTYKAIDGGMPQVINVLFMVFEKTNNLTENVKASIYRKIYRNTFPFWVLDYKHNNAIPAALGLVDGLKPWKTKNFRQLNILLKIEICLTWFILGFGSFVFPSALFYRFKNQIYSFLKK
jgi:glycosyltransferase involved in cell wall biosynthesis